jgi:Uma2 family endonuclease
VNPVEKPVSTAIQIWAEQEQSLTIPAWVVDFESFRRWTDAPDFPETGRISYIDGEVLIDMAAQEVDSHVRVKSAVGADLRTFVRSRDLGEVLIDGARVVNDEAVVSNEPDVVFLSRESIRSGRVALREITEGSGRLMEVAGSPDLLVEVLSRSSRRKDAVTLRNRYFLAGVAEYWLIDARGGTVDFTLLVRGGEGFVPVEADEDGYRRSGVLGASFWLERRDDPDGLTQYDLRSRLVSVE